MTNLVDRLRAFPGGFGAEALCREAADEIERWERESAWQSKEIDAQVQEIQRLRNREKDLMAVIDSRDKALGFVPLEDDPCGCRSAGPRYEPPWYCTIHNSVPASEAYSGKPDQSRDRVPPGLGEVLTSPDSSDQKQNATPGATIEDEDSVSRRSESSWPRELQPSEAASFDKTLARSPRRINPVTSGPCPLCGRTDPHSHTAGPMGMS